MSDQTISNSPGSKQQSARHGSGPLWRNSFYTFTVRHRKQAMRRNQPERGERQIIWQGREQLSPPRLAVPQPLGKAGWALWASPANPCDLGVSAEEAWCEFYPPSRPGWLQSLGSRSGFGLFCELQYVHGWAFLLSKVWELVHAPLPTVKPNCRALLSLLVKVLVEGWTIFFFNLLDCFPSLFWTTE